MTAAQLQVATTATRDEKSRLPAQAGKDSKAAASSSRQQLRKQPRLPKSVLRELDKKVTP